MATQRDEAALTGTREEVKGVKNVRLGKNPDCARNPLAEVAAFICFTGIFSFTNSLAYALPFHYSGLPALLTPVLEVPLALKALVLLSPAHSLSQLSAGFEEK